MSFAELTALISPKFTEDVLMGILKAKSGLSDIKVKNVTRMDDSKKGDSYLSNITRFTVEAAGNNNKGFEESFSLPIIAKYLPANIGRRKTFRSAEFFENEIIFYETVWSAMQKFRDSKNVPDKFDKIPWLASAYADGNYDYVALEDLSYKGYATLERGCGLDRVHTMEILGLFARFHGLGLAFRDQQPEVFEKVANSLKETYFSEKQRGWYENFHAVIANIAKDAVVKELPPKYLEKFEKIIAGDSFGRLCGFCQDRGPLATIAHGDAWLPNFLVKYAADDVEKKTPIDSILIDFQLTRYTSLSTDLVFFLFTGVNVDLLEANWDDFLVHYHRVLSETLEKYGSKRDLITFETFKADMIANTKFGVGMSMEGLVMSLLDDEEVSDFDQIQGDQAVPIETVWLVHPLKDQEKRQRLAAMIKFVVDRNFI